MVSSAVIRAGVAAAGAMATYDWLASVTVKKEKPVKKFIEKLLDLLGLDSILTKKRKLAPIQVGSTQVWYGRVNAWHYDKSMWRKEMDTLVKHGGAGYMIELSSWQSNSDIKWWTDAWVKKIVELYREIHADAKARGLWLFVSVVNDNMGSGKYGDKKQYTVANCYDKLVRILDGIITDGSDNVVVQPVAETQTPGGKKFEAYAKDRLNKRGFLTCNNGSGGHPTSTNGMTYYAVHPSKVSVNNPSNAFVVSDHGQIIRELNGGPLVGHGNPAKISQWVQLNKKRGCPVVGYYAFKVEDYDGDAIKALCTAAKSPVSVQSFSYKNG